MEAEAIHAELEQAQVVDHGIFDGVRAIPGLMDTVVASVDQNLTEMNVMPPLCRATSQRHPFRLLPSVERARNCQLWGTCRSSPVSGPIHCA